MGTLQERLRNLQEHFEKKAPAEVIEVMYLVSEDLCRSWNREQVPKPCGTSPPSSLCPTQWGSWSVQRTS